MKLSNLVTNVFLALGLAATAQAQWIKLPLPDTPRDKDGKPVLSAPAPRMIFPYIVSGTFRERVPLQKQKSAAFCEATGAAV